MSAPRVFGPPPFYVPPCFQPGAGRQGDLTDPIEDELVELVRQGLTQNQIAYRTGMAASSVSDKLKTLGLNARAQKVVLVAERPEWAPAPIPVREAAE